MSRTAWRLPPRIAVCAAAAAAPAHAHHPTGGSTPATAWEGVLSGIGHPVIGADHAVFLLAAGLLVAWASGADRRRAAALCFAFAVSGALGTSARVAFPWLGGLEPLVGVSLLAVAGALLSGRAPGAGGSTAMAALAGFVHGHAFGESVVGSEPTPMLAYVAGLALTQTLLLACAYAGGRRVAGRAPHRVAASRRLAGVVAAAVGLAAAVGALAG